jgi:hypothetical protein
LYEQSHLDGKNRYHFVNPLARPVNYLKSIGPKPHLVFIGTQEREWYGISLLEKIATAFPAWQFSVIGIPKFQTTIPNISIYEHMSNSALNNFLKSVDLGIASLALGTDSLVSASSIKVSKYIENCLPIISTHRDFRVPTSSPIFFLFNPNYDAQSLHALQTFVERWATNPPKYDYFSEIWDNFLSMPHIESVLEEISGRIAT